MTEEPKKPAPIPANDGKQEGKWERNDKRDGYHRTSGGWASLDEVYGE